jgi:acyl carrier protein/pimeloyl-ACP methyl ester carboxylesterase
MNDSGVHALTPEQGTALFDTASELPAPALVPIALDLKALRSAAGELPALFRGLIRTTTRRAASSTADASALRRKLEEADDGDRERILLETVLETTAAVLGHASTDAIAPEKDFLEAGVDSLSAMELRGRLSALTGVALPPMAVFDSKTPAGLARRLAEAAMGATEDRPADRVTEQAEDSDTVSGLFRSTVLAGQTTKAFALLRAVADLRPTFQSYEELTAPPTAVRLAHGPARPRLICMSTPMATGGVHQHARLAAHFRDVRSVATLPSPGFERGEPLPDSVGALTSALARSVLEAAEGEPFVLMGYSSGGLLAHGTAARLEEEFGLPAAGLVLVDTYRVTQEAGGGMQAQVFEQLAGALVDRDSQFGLFDTTGLSAMRAYFDLLPLVPLEPVATPVLFVGAERSFLSGDQDPSGLPSASGTDEGWRARPWHADHTYRTVPATHFTIVEEDAQHTARVMEEWISGVR